MAIPRSKHTKSRRNKSRMHIYIKRPVFGICPKCGKETRPHTVCWNCGYYKGEEIINILEKLTKKERKKREKEMAAKEKGETSTKPLSMEEVSKK
ncbi:MAG: 50S ribosomal protein L32 [Candidatus Magasanikbacteria bacterium]|nr:50S ribosomal protein L32 [Candidatus Magasanikbacteria bacterium]